MADVSAREALLPCPFCNDTRRLSVSPGGAQKQTSVFCTNCGAMGPSSWGHDDNVPPAIAAWNTRALPAAGWNEAMEAAASQCESDAKMYWEGGFTSEHAALTNAASEIRALLRSLPASPAIRDGEGGES